MQIDTIADIKFDKEIISYLSVLKPATTAILLSPTKADLKTIIQCTVMDLVLKNVISVAHKEIRLHSTDPYKRPRIIVETAENFTTYRKSIYETYFLGIIDEESYFQLYSYLSRIYHELPLDNIVKKSIIKEHNIKNLFSIVFTFDSFGIFRLNRHGNKVRNEIMRYFVTIEHNLEQMIEDSPEKVLHLLSFMKGNFFLLRNVTIDLIEKINIHVQEYKKHRKDAYLDLFGIFEFSEIFFSDISQEMKESLRKIERSYKEQHENS